MLTKKSVKQKALGFKDKKPDPNHKNGCWLFLVVLAIIAIGVLMSNWHLIF